MYDHLAALQFELGEMEAAEKSYRASLLRNGAVAATHRNLAKVLYSQGRMAESLEELRMALQLEPGNPDSWEGLGMSALALGDRETARWAAEKLRSADRQAWERLQAEIARTLP